jgi:hypothetical protein
MLHTVLADFHQKNKCLGWLLNFNFTAFCLHPPPAPLPTGQGGGSQELDRKVRIFRQSRRRSSGPSSITALLPRRSHAERAAARKAQSFCRWQQVSTHARTPRPHSQLFTPLTISGCRLPQNGKQHRHAHQHHSLTPAPLPTQPLL